MRCIQLAIIALITSSLVACGSNMLRRAEIYEEHADYRSALDVYQQLADGPGVEHAALAHAALGRLNVKLGRFWEAKEHLEQAKSQIPSANSGYGEVCYYLGYCYYQIGEQWSQQAIDTLEEAVSTVPKAHVYLSVLYYEQGQYESALRHADRIAGDDEAQAKYISGLIYRKLGGLENLQKSMLVLQRAVEVERSLETKRKYQTLLEDVDKEIQGIHISARKIDNVDLDSVFAAIYRCYERVPVGRAIVRNPTPAPLRNVTLFLEIRDFMDQPESYSLGNLAPQANITVELKVHFNSKMLEISQDLDAVPVSLTLQYTSDDGQRIEGAAVEHLRIHEPHAINWQPQEAIATFVTHKNPVVTTFSRHASILGNPLEKAIQIYEALKLYGMQYELDPQDPYGQDADYIFYPCETLRLRKGDCDDLSVLYASALQNIGIDTAFVLTPNHIFVMFNTGMSEARAKRVIPDGNLFMSRGGMAWIPVEVTMLGKSQTNFLSAWLKGVEEFRSDYPVIEVSKAWAEFQPLTNGSDIPNFEELLPDKEEILKAYNQTVADAEAHWQHFFEEGIRYLEKQTSGGNGNTSDLLNRKAVRLAWMGRLEEAEQALRQATTSAPMVVRYHNNLANVLLLQGKADNALEEYQQTLAGGEVGNIPVHLNLAIYYLAVQDSEKAQAELTQIGGEDPEQAASEQVLTLARELGIPITTSPRAGDLPNLVRDKVSEAAESYDAARLHEQLVRQLLARLEESLTEDEQLRLRSKLMTLSTEQLTAISADQALQVSHDLVLEPEAQAAPPDSAEDIASASEEPSAQVETGEPLKVSQDQLQTLLSQIFSIESQGTRASGISEPEGLQWWLYWME